MRSERKIHHLKTDATAFDATVAGLKPYDIRETRDRDFMVGDYIVLHRQTDPPERQPTGEQLLLEVTWILEGGQYGIEKDFVVLSHKLPDQFVPPINEGSVFVDAPLSQQIVNARVGVIGDNTQIEGGIHFDD